MHAQERFGQFYSRVFEPIQNLDLRVGMIWINPADLPMFLERLDVFDRNYVAQTRVPDAVFPGVYEGTLFGAMVMSTDIVPKGRAIAVPEGILVREIEAVAAFPLGWA